MWFAVFSAAWACPSPGVGGPVAPLPPPRAPFDQEARIDGMVARWRSEGATWVVQLEATTQGWLVFGTNPQAGIKGSELYFGWVVDGQGHAAHHVVEAPGRHVPAQPERVTLLASGQTPTGTAVRLEVPAPRPDADGGTWLVLAWSRAPELDHHSAVRRHVHVAIGASAPEG